MFTLELSKLHNFGPLQMNAKGKGWCLLVLNSDFQRLQQFSSARMPRSPAISITFLLLRRTFLRHQFWTACCTCGALFFNREVALFWKNYSLFDQVEYHFPVNAPFSGQSWSPTFRLDLPYELQCHISLLKDGFSLTIPHLIWRYIPNRRMHVFGVVPVHKFSHPVASEFSIVSKAFGYVTLNSDSMCGLCRYWSVACCAKQQR